MQFTLIDKFSESEDIVTFVWESPEPIGWKPGQFIKYSLPHNDADERGTSRWFTVAAPPYESKPRITTRFATEHGSSFKSHLYGLQIGATIEAGRPSGDFTVDDPSRPFVLVAGGIGITPYRAILLQLDHDHVDIKGCLLYANRNDHYTFRDEFEALAARHPGFTIQYFTDPKRMELNDIKAAAANLDTPLYYLSGPEPMVESYKNLLTNASINEENIKTDYFPGYSA